MRPSRRRRVGIIYLEIQVALVVLGVGLAGLCPLVVMQLKLLKRLEAPDPSTSTPLIIRGVRMAGDLPYDRAGGVETPVPMVVQPQPDAWSRRLGIPPTIATAPTSPTPPATPGRQSVAVVNQVRISQPVVASGSGFVASVKVTSP